MIASGREGSPRDTLERAPPGSSRSGTVLLVVPPFWRSDYPNLGVSQLKANLVRAGHDTEVLYLNLLFSKRLGVRVSDRLNSTGYHTMLGEFVFSAAAFGQDPGRVDDYLSEVLQNTDALRFIAQQSRHESPAAVLRRWREEAIAFCDGEGREAILASDARIVGFSSNFQQNCASLALMDRIKRVRPDVVTVMGGANCEGEMGEELMSRFAQIDYLGQGECDHALVALADALDRGEDGHGIPGIRGRGSQHATGPAKPLSRTDLDDLPYPDYDDFVSQREALGINDHTPWALCVETSRGCWWGAKHHCTFCGLNGLSMEYRSKSPSRALSEIDWLLDRHGPVPIRMADNILDLKYFKALLPSLAEAQRTTIFYEIKANLTREQVRLLAAARVNEVQPGIESLSDESLRLMRKGSTRMQNVQMLKWSAEYGVRVVWNYLLGFPGENDDELPEIADAAESLHHLDPPSGFGVLHLDRFSPYFDSAEEFGLAPITPHKGYRHVYPFAGESLARLAYFFGSESLTRKANGAGVQIIDRMVSRWQAFHKGSVLLAVPRRSSLFIVDTRRCARRWVHRLTGVRRAVYEQCDSARSVSEIARALGESASTDAIHGAIASLVRNRLLLASAGRYLALAVEPDRRLTYATRRKELPSARRRPSSSRVTREIDRLVERLRSPGTLIRGSARGLRDRWARRTASGLVRLLRETDT